MSIKGTAKNHYGEVNVPIFVGGVKINPGDILLGDQDGIVIVKSKDTKNKSDNFALTYSWYP